MSAFKVSVNAGGTSVEAQVGVENWLYGSRGTMKERDENKDSKSEMGRSVYDRTAEIKKASLHSSGIQAITCRSCPFNTEWLLHVMN
jgi:hypothetical protein